MKLKNILPLAFAALMFAACNQTNEQTSSTQSSDDAITELMMSRRSIRNYKGNHSAKRRIYLSGVSRKKEII